MNEPKNQAELAVEHQKLAKVYAGTDIERLNAFYAANPSAYEEYRRAPAPAYVSDHLGRLVLAETVPTPPTPLTATEAERRFSESPKGRGHAQAVVDARVRAAMAGDPKLSFGEAANAIFAADPGLYQRYRHDAANGR